MCFQSFYAVLNNIVKCVLLLTWEFGEVYSAGWYCRHKVNVIKTKDSKFYLLQLYTIGRQYILSIMNKNKCALTLVLTRYSTITVKPRIHTGSSVCREWDGSKVSTVYYTNVNILKAHLCYSAQCKYTLKQMHVHKDTHKSQPLKRSGFHL